MPLTQVQGQMLNGSNNTTTTIQSNGTTAITIDSSQNVGIGTNSPASKLTVQGSIRHEYASNTALYTTVNYDGISVKGAQDAYYLVDSGQNQTWYVGATERMRITSAGEVCINRTSSLGSAKLHVTNASGDANNWVVSLKASATSVATTMIAFYDGAETFCGQVYVDPVANTTVYSTSSDYRLKDNVVPMTGALAKVQALNPVTYTWKKSGKTGQGFIAHELQEIVPECVVGEKDAMETYTDEEGNEQTAILPQMVDTSFLVATLTAAIQELKAELDATKAEVAELKARGQ